MTKTGPRQYSVATFGHFMISTRHGRSVTPRGRKARALLAYCIAKAPDGIQRERLATLLWGDRGEQQARASLRQTLYELREFTGGETPLLQSDREQVWIDATRMVTEIELIESAVKAGDAAQAASLIGDRPSELFEDLTGVATDFDQWLATERAHWRERRRQMGLALAKQAHTAGEYATARRLALALLALDPLDEAAALIAMDAIGALGDRDEGRRLLAQLEKVLHAELGVAPSAAVRASHDRLIIREGGVAAIVAAGPTSVTADPVLANSPAGGRSSASKAAIASLLFGAVAIAFVMLRGPSQTTSARAYAAVLPFTSPDGDAQARLIAKTTESAVIDAMAAIGRPVVVPTVAARLEGPDAQENARQLNVPYLVRGEVRRDRRAIRIVLRLDDIAHGVTLLSQSFERPVENAGDLPDQVAASAASAIGWTRTLTEIDPKGSSDPRLATGFLRHQAAISQGDAGLAYDEATQLIAQYPESPLSQIALAYSTSWVLTDIALAERPAVLRRGRAAADRARVLAPMFGDAYAPQCTLSPRLWYKPCEASLRHALAVDPRALTAAAYLSNLLFETGRSREALPWQKTAFEFSPFNSHRASAYLYIVEALDIQPEVAWIGAKWVRYWPDSPQITEGAFMGLASRGAWSAAGKLINERRAGFVFLSPEELAALNALVAHLNDRNPDLKAVRLACERREPPLVFAFACLAGLASKNDRDGAFALADRYFPDLRANTPQGETNLWLNKGQNHYPSSILFGRATKPLRSDPRFTALADRLRLREYWRSNGWPDLCAVERSPVCHS